MNAGGDLDAKKTDRTRRVLIYRYGQLGDTLAALPALWVVRERFADAHCALLSEADPSRRHVNAEAVLPKGLIDEWITYTADDHGTRYTEGLQLAWRLRRKRFDTLVYLLPRTRSPLAVRRDLIFFWLVGIRTFIGHLGIEPLPARGARPLPAVVQEADHLLQRLERSGFAVPSPGRGRMDLRLTNDEQRRTENWLQHRGADVRVARLVAIGPGSKWPSKIWPGDRYLELGRRLIHDFGVTPLVMGGPEEADLGDRLTRGWMHGINTAGLLTVRESAAAMALCRLYIGNDTGTMHLAAAVGTPCVAVFSAQDWPGRWFPYGSGHRVLRRSVPCEGCQLRVCDRRLECLDDISVDEVVEACGERLCDAGVA